MALGTAELVRSELEPDDQLHLSRQTFFEA